MKGSSYMYEVLSDPATALSGEAKASALCKAFNTKETIWEFFDEPAQKDRRNRFGVAMKGVATFQPMELTIKGNIKTTIHSCFLINIKSHLYLQDSTGLH